MNKLVIILSTGLFLVSHSIACASIDSLRLQFDEGSLSRIRNVRNSDPDSALGMLSKYYAETMKKKNYPEAVQILMEMAYVYGNQARYREAYDQSWKALLLADRIGNDRLKAEIYMDLGRRYSYFKRREEALDYFNKSLQINRDLVREGKLNKTSLARNFYALVATFRELDEPAQARRYLDSCLVYYKDDVGVINRSFLKFEQAYIESKRQNYQIALNLFREIEPWFLEHYPSYLVLVYTYWGDIFRSMDNYEEGIAYYAKALKFSKEYSSHLDFTPLIHERMANLYLSRKNYKMAYESQTKAKILNEIYFDSRSKINRPLLEIQDAFRIEKERGEQLLKKQRLIELEHQDQVGALQKTLLILSLLFLIIIGVISYGSLRARHKAEKELMQRKRELEKQQDEELIELRNKELTTSALKLIEKDELLANLKKDLSGKEGDVSPRDIKRAIKSISVSNTQNWQEFETRFVSVNTEFYQQLHERFPDLTPGEQKLCALIKLNFSSKEIARLMGISVGSAHTTRYRLRKKLGLSRDENLTEFISGL
ncbi:tetratricopeptide repeat protein [Persicitalea jodogahamensis]|uniref:HTH luxR-type domain-containing protein n=1 Tax=Persicitalea jodogahamensis TaxID=402147 RepID=A0A8J3DC04_9BACT|nr:tetratricopeptide repeat protein [Persicitalea jodogahamensis]GHB75002.1 hypothetical protein GCM10007390_30890 [Persicitalea jodogahamensis]